jgi:hypothetical protein
MTTITTPSSLALAPSLETAWQDVDSSFERFCLTAGIGAIEQMLCEDAHNSPARHIIVAEAGSATAGAEPREDRFPWWQGCRASPAGAQLRRP